jgi:hypothetical protein
MSDRPAATQGKSLRKKDFDEPAAGGATPAADVVEDKNALIYTRLKQIYRAAVLPVEKRYRYDYFYESPFMSDVEFDGKKVETREISRLTTTIVFDTQLLRPHITFFRC